MRCKNCYTVLPEHVTSCPKCGVQVNTETNKQQDNTQAQQQNNLKSEIMIRRLDFHSWLKGSAGSFLCFLTALVSTIFCALIIFDESSTTVFDQLFKYNTAGKLAFHLTIDGTFFARLLNLATPLVTTIGLWLIYASGSNSDDPEFNPIGFEIISKALGIIYIALVFVLSLPLIGTILMAFNSADRDSFASLLFSTIFSFCISALPLVIIFLSYNKTLKALINIAYEGEPDDVPNASIWVSYLAAGATLFLNLGSNIQFSTILTVLQFILIGCLIQSFITTVDTYTSNKEIDDIRSRYNFGEEKQNSTVDETPVKEAAVTSKPTTYKNDAPAVTANSIIKNGQEIIICPVCQTEQRPGRSVCFRCGQKFKTDVN